MRYSDHTDPVITLTAGPVNAYADVLRGLGRTVLYDYDPAFQLFYEKVVGKAQRRCGFPADPSSCMASRCWALRRRRHR